MKPETYNDKINDVKRKKNIIISELASKNSLVFLDINQYMINLAQKRRSRYLHVDHIHFEEKAKPVIVKKYLEYL